MTTIVPVETGANPSVGSPLWWTERLYNALTNRQPTVEYFDQYYRGDHHLPWLPHQVRDLAIRILRMSRTNVMGLVCDATVERLEPIGFQVGDTTGGDLEAWRIWQANNLDAIIGEAFLEAVKCGCSYLMVAPNPRDLSTPRVTVEHPSQVFVEYDPEDMRERRAGIKVWFNDIVGEVHATTFVDGWIFKWRGPKNSKPSKWTPRYVDGEDWPARNPLGEVPIIELQNNPQTTYSNGELIRIGISEMTDVTDIQDRINKTVADRLVTQDFGAFPQKWAKGWGSDEDPDEDVRPQGSAQYNGTGLNTPHPASRVNFGRDRLIVAEDENTEFGQWDSAPLAPYTDAKNSDVKDIAARTRTPSQYLLGELVNISAEALHAAESGLVSKVKQRMRPFGEALEETVRLYLTLAGDPRAQDKVEMQTLWRDPEYRSMAALTDAVMKLFQRDPNGGPGMLSWQAAAEKLGMTPQEIATVGAQRRKEQVQAQALEMTRATQMAALAPKPTAPTDPAPSAGAQPQ